jgi:hypothetical protein
MRKTPQSVSTYALASLASTNALVRAFSCFCLSYASTKTRPIHRTIRSSPPQQTREGRVACHQPPPEGRERSGGRLKASFGVHGRKLNPALSILVARPALPVSNSRSPTRRKGYSSSTHPAPRREPSHRKPYRLQEKMRRTEQFSQLLRPTPHMPHLLTRSYLMVRLFLHPTPRGLQNALYVMDSTRVAV